MTRNELREIIATELEDGDVVADDHLIETLVQVAESYAKAEREWLAQGIAQTRVHPDVAYGMAQAARIVRGES